jgi:GrpB-like predicted nucleotidyltransferase (UPF0157 family)
MVRSEGLDARLHEARQRDGRVLEVEEVGPVAQRVQLRGHGAHDGDHRALREVVVHGGEQWTNYLRFRDLLLRHDLEARRRYEAEKARLASDHPNDRRPA